MVPLRLTIEKVQAPGDGYRVTLESAGAVLAAAPIPATSPPFDFKAAQQRILEDALTTGPEFLTLGQQLFGWAFSGGLAAAFDPCYQGAPWPCVQLELKSEEAAIAPWELLCTPAFLRLSATGGLVRLYRAQRKPTGANAEWPLRMLVLVGCSQDQRQALGVADELAAIEQEFLRFGRSVDLNVLETPTAAKLQAWLAENQPQVLHFVGHCIQDPGTKTSALLISNPEKAWPWKATDIPQYLARMKSPFRFVFLNACRSAVQYEQSWSIQQAFLENGVPAVLAMQANIKGPFAGTFAAGFYKSCAEGADLPGAACAGRERLRDDQLGGTYDSRDWALPSLTMNATVVEQGPFYLFAPKPVPEEEAFKKCREFEEARWFADFRELRRSVTRWFYPLAPPTGDKGGRTALVVVGESRCGKSHLVKWCLESFAFSQPRIRYVPVNEGKPKNFLDLLRQIRDGEVIERADPEEYTLLHSGLDPRAFRRFNWELNNLLVTGRKGEWVEASQPDVIPDARAPLLAAGENLLPFIFSSFADALREYAKVRPLVLVLDQFSGPQGERFMPAEEFKAMLRGLFLPLVQEGETSVKLVFTASKADYDYYGLSALPRDRVQLVTVQHEFTDEQVLQCAREMFWYKLDPSLELIAQGVAKRRSANLKGLARLSVLRSLLEGDASGEATWVERMR